MSWNDRAGYWFKGMKKFTPGDWKFFAGSATIGVARNSPESGDYALIATMCRTRPEASANAQLFAAAPNLLEACEEIERALTLSGWNLESKEAEDLVKKLRGAITRAIGS